MTFAQNPPRNWDELSSKERKERVCKSVGINPAYLQQLITRNEALKDFFGIVRRRRRDRVQVRPQEIVRQANMLELNDLLQVSRLLRVEIQRRIAIAQAEVNAK